MILKQIVFVWCVNYYSTLFESYPHWVSCCVCCLVSTLTVFAVVWDAFECKSAYSRFAVVVYRWNGNALVGLACFGSMVCDDCCVTYKKNKFSLFKS